MSESKIEWEGIKSSIYGTVAYSLLAIVGTGALVALIASLYKWKNDKKEDPLVKVSKQIGSIGNFDTTVLVPGNPTSYVPGIIEVNVNNVYDISLEFKTKLNFNLPDPALEMQVLTAFFNYMSTLNITTQDLVGFNIKYRKTSNHGAQSYSYRSVDLVMTNDVEEWFTYRILDMDFTFAGGNSNVLYVTLELYDDSDGVNLNPTGKIIKLQYFLGPNADIISQKSMLITDGNELSLSQLSALEYRITQQICYILKSFFSLAQDTADKKDFKQKKRANKNARDMVTRANAFFQNNEVVLVAKDQDYSLKSRPRNAKETTYKDVTSFESVLRCPPINVPSQNFTSLRNMVIRNAVQVRNNMTGALQYGLGIKGRILVANRHTFHGLQGRKNDISIICDNLQPADDENVTSVFEAELLFTDEANDFAVLQVKEPTFPQFKDITSCFISDSDRQNVTSAVFVTPNYESPSVICRAEIPIKFIPKKASFGIDNTPMTFTGEYIEASFTEMNFRTRPGDCGSPYLVDVGKSAEYFRIAGIHSLGNSLLGRTWGILLTRELIASYLSQIDTPQAQSSAKFSRIYNVDFKKEIGEEEVETVSTDIAISQEISESQVYNVTPRNSWPLFRPNQYEYGEIEESNLTFLGYSSRYLPSYARGHTREHQPSIFVPLLQEKNLSCPVQNSIMDPRMVADTSQLLKATNTGVPSIVYTQISYYNDPVTPHPQFEQLLKDTIDELIPFWTKWYSNRDHRLLSLNETINGLYLRTDSLHGALDGIDLKASPGLFATRHLHVGKKQEFYEIDTKAMEIYNSTRTMYTYSNSTVGKHMKARYLQKIEHADRGKWLAYFAKDSLKDELVKNEKAYIGKTRLFTAMDDADVNFARSVNGTYCAQVKLSHTDRHCQVGIDAWKEFDRLARRLENTSFIGEAGDFKHWDKNALVPVIKGVFELMAETVTLYMNPEDTAKMRRLMKILYLDIVHTFSFCDGIFYQKHRGIPSGTFLTATLNSDVNFVYHVLNCKINIILWNETTIFKPLPATLQYILRNTDCVVYGDDKKTALTSEIAVCCNFKTMQKVFKDYFGLQYTDPAKGDTVTLTMDLTELDFLSRSSRKAINGVVMPCLKRESLFGMVWYISQQSKDVYYTTLLNLYKELRLLPREEYDDWRELWSECVKKFESVYGYSSLPYLPSYERNLYVTTKEILET